MTSAKRVLIWGAGGHGRVVADVVRASGLGVAGFVAQDAARGDTPPTIAEDDLLRVLPSLPLDADAVAIAIGDNAVRRRCLERLEGVPLPVLRHPSAAVSESAIVGPGTVIFPGAVVNAGARLGPGVIVNSGAIVEHDCVLGGFVHVSPGAVLAGNVTVADEAWIGAGAVIIPGVRIGAGAIVGAGAVVIRDVEQHSIVAGTPARPIRRSDRP